MIKHYPVTASGLAEFKEEKESLLTKRKTAVISLRTAREMGDLSENAAYKVARMELSSIDARLRKLEYIIRFARVVTTNNMGTVGFDSKVKLEYMGKMMEFTVVGGYESDPAKGKISHISPLGKALFGKRAGDEIKVNTPKGVAVYRIAAILE